MNIVCFYFTIRAYILRIRASNRFTLNCPHVIFHYRQWLKLSFVVGISNVMYT